jgi:hypothetical protein
MTLRRFLTIGLLIPWLGLAVGVAVSRLYWGYWLLPPSSHEIIEDVATVDRFSKVSWDGVYASGRLVLLEAAATANTISGEEPFGRLPRALAQRSLFPITEEPVDPSLLPAVVSALAASGNLVPASPEYPNTTRLSGNLAVAFTRAGNPCVLAALSGGEVSNDHRPFYEAAFALDATNRLIPQRLHFYYYDVAGLEGIAHWLAGGFTILVALVLWLISGLVFLAIRWRRRTA